MSEFRDDQLNRNGGSMPSSSQGSMVAERAPTDDPNKIEIVADEARDEAQQIKDRALDAAGDVKETAKEELAVVKDEAIDQVHDVLSEARTRVTEEADRATRQLGQQLAEIGYDFEQMAQASPDPGSVATQFVGELGVRTSRVAQRIGAQGYQGMTLEIKRYARQNPGTFLLGAALTGFVVGRLLRNTDTKAIGQALSPSSSGGNGASTSPSTTSSTDTTALAPTYDATGTTGSSYPAEPATSDQIATGAAQRSMLG